jgi:phage terminase Nu1 subunit (DNA packaging protein)
VTGGFTKTEIAKAFGVKPATVDKWVEEGIPREKVGRAYRYGWEAVKWAHEKRSKNGRTDAASSLREARERLELRKAELDLDKALGELVPLSVFDDVLEELLRRLDAKVGSIPRKWGPDLLGHEGLAEIVAMLERKTDELRGELRRIDESSRTKT